MMKMIYYILQKQLIKINLYSYLQKKILRIPKSYRSLINTLEGEIVFEKESLIKEILTNVIENQIQNAK